MLRRQWWNREGVLTLLWWSRQRCILTPLWKTAASPWRRRHADRRDRHALIRVKPYRRLFSVLWLMSVEQRQESRQDSPFPSWCISSSCLSFSDSKPWQQNTVKRKWVVPSNAAELWTHTGGRLLIMHRPQIRAGIRNSGGNCFNELCTDVGEVTRKTLFFNNHADK